MKEDCLEEDEAYQQENYGEEALFCTLCNTEVLSSNPIQQAEYIIL